MKPEGSGRESMHFTGCDMALWQLLCVAVLSSTLAASTVVSQGRLAAVNGINYYVSAPAVSKLESSVSLNWTDPADILPLTVIRTNTSIFSDRVLQETVDNFTASDDVFQPGFLKGQISNILAHQIG